MGMYRSNDLRTKLESIGDWSWIWSSFGGDKLVGSDMMVMPFEAVEELVPLLK
jgi:hypothetical protein